MKKIQEKLFNKSKFTTEDKLRNFTKYISRKYMSRFLVQHELFKKQINIELSNNKHKYLLHYNHTFNTAYEVIFERTQWEYCPIETRIVKNGIEIVNFLKKGCKITKNNCSYPFVLISRVYTD